MPVFNFIPDCRNCGACCQHHSKIVVGADDPNLDYLLENDLAQTDEEVGYRMRTDGNCRCIALDGEAGESVECSIYEKRPVACQIYVAGAGQCEIARLFQFGVDSIKQN